MQRLLYSERYYWRCSALIILLIFSTLFIGNPLRQWWDNQDGHAFFFVIGMALVAGCIALGGLFFRDRWENIALRMGLAAIFVMFLLRLSLAERSHIIEYSVLAYCIFKALSTRNKGRGNESSAYLQSAILCIIIALIDEGLQTVLPQRIGSWEDIVFDVGAVGFALGGVAILRGVKKPTKN